jgi:predicted alpha-1,2-mannosidase
MNRSLLLLLILSLSSLFGQKNLSNSSCCQYVNPFIGTGGHGHTYPGASAPFGMIQISPDTRKDDWDGCSGYHYSDSIIYGFSQTHLSGTGVPDYCDLLIVPQSGKAKIVSKLENAKKGYGSRFLHSDEKASPGYYEVLLKEENIKVRLTSGQRCGLHEYTFLNLKEKKYILLDLDPRDKLLSANINVLSKNQISGSRISEGWAREQHFYFYLETSEQFVKAKKIKSNGRHKLLLEFPSKTEQVLLKIGISAVDENGAKNNLKELEFLNKLNVQGTEFFKIFKKANEKRWEDELSKISIASENEEKKIIFYSALYHSFLAPNLFSDFDGRYLGRDNKIHEIEKNKNQYSVFSLWDTYRGTHPLFTLIQQKKTSEFINTFLNQFDQGGDLPVWELAGNETECMIGYHSVSVIADAYLKGIRGFDTTKALKAMVATSNFDELGKKQFRNQGFISSSDEPESVSKTLEYAYDDFCISEMAKAMKNDSIFKAYYKSSFNFINLLDPSTGFMRARRGAQWYGPFDPSEVNFNYTEANSWQYSLYAPQHIESLTNLLGGKDSLEHWLDRLFTTEMKLSGREQADITGLIGQYAHGNEPSHHMAYLYNFTNAPFKAQVYVDKILNELYHNAPDGLAGNEDCGQMSSWFVLSSIGFYPIAPGSTKYQIGRPLFDQVSLNLENGNQIAVIALNNSSLNKYIQSVKWNNEPLVKLEIDHNELIKGGMLVFEMGPSPKVSNQVDVLRSNQFYNEKVAEEFVPVPFVKVEQRVFEEKMKIALGYHTIHPNEQYFLFYSLDSVTWETYEKPFFIDKSTRIYLKLQRRSNNQKVYYSPVVWCDFIKKDPTIHLSLQTKFSNQYAASGENALIDGIRGGNEYRTGDWQGFFGEDIVARVNFDQPRKIEKIGASCIRDQKSWIFLPSEIQIEISKDGENFIKLNPIIIPKAKENDSNPKVFEFDTSNSVSEEIKAIRYLIKNPGNCPEWHLGKGNKTWLFVDELIFR